MLCQPLQESVKKIAPLNQKVLLIFDLFLQELIGQTVLRWEQWYWNTPIFLLEAFLQVDEVRVPPLLFPFALLVHAFAREHNMCWLFNIADASEALLVFGLVECPLFDKVCCHI